MKAEFRVSLDVAKKLKEAGYPQDGCDAYWSNNGCEWNIYAKGDGGNLDNHYAAPCVGQLGKELPDTIFYENVVYMLRQTKLCVNNKMMYCLIYENIDAEEDDLLKVKKYTEADARAYMWIELKKKGLL